MTRRGASKLGCLVKLLLLAVIAYFGANIGGVYWRYYQFRDAMRQEVRFAPRKTDQQIITTLRLKADSLGLPEGAQNVQVRRTTARITVWSDYSETVELPLTIRHLRFQPRAEGTL